MTDGCPDPAEQRERFAERQREAGVSTKRFIDVHDGEKRSTDHTQREPDDPRLRGNYGVYGGRGADREGLWLVDVDVDDYADAEAATDGLDALPETFTIESPHTDGETGGHRYYAVRGDIAGAFRERLERDVENPSPAWGEVRVSNQYCVGPGSQLDGCSKEWCDRCAEADGGHYRIAADREIAVLELEEFVDAIVADLPDDRTADQASVEGGDGDAEGRGGRAQDVEPGPGLPDDTDVDERLETALEADDKLCRLWHGRYRSAGYGSDRSKAESALAAKLGWWFGQDPTTVRRLMDRANTQKWCDRTDASYRDSILSAVGGEAYYTPDSGGGRYDVEVCEPPERDPVELDVGERRAELTGERFDDVLEDDRLHAWAHEAGVGKTTCSGLGALGRGEDHAIYFDKHRKAREHVTDPVIDGDYYHLKGGEQKRDGRCMDADHARERGEDAECPEHGHPSGCPSMCPVYDLEPDDEHRQAYEALVGEVGPFRAHMVLGLTEDDEHLWHPEECAWMEQYDEVDSRANVAAVHPYLTQKTVREDRLNIIDEAVDLYAEDRTLSVEDLTRMANALEDVADVQPRDEAAGYTLRGLASFARDLIDVITAADADPDEIAISRLSPPEIIWSAYETYNDVAGHHVAREEPTEGWHVAEALADAKVEYGESVLSRMHRDEWNGESLSIDPLLAVAATAGLPTDAVMKAVAAPAILEACPWCRSDVEHHNGARCCSDDGCGWNEREHTLTRKDGEQARATAWVHTDHDDRPVGLGYRALPLPSQLPDPGDTLALDATATPEKIAALFDVPTDEVVVSGDQDLELSNLRVTQVPDGQYHGQTIKDAIDEERTLAGRIQRAIDTAGEIYERPLYVAKKDLIPRFDFPENGEVMHYHATRGLNRADCDTVVLIGAPHPDVEDLRRNAELLATGREDLRVGGEEYSTRRDAPNPPVYRKLNFTDENGDGRAVPTKAYSGLVGDLFRENRENELEQAVHRIRPLLANDGETKHAYLLTNVPTDLPIDEVCSFEELADPLEAMLPVPEGAIDLLEAVRDVTAGDGPDGFRDPGRLVEQREDGTLANKVSGYHRLARLSGLDVTERTVYNWVAALEDVGLLRPESYEQRQGGSYAVEFSTLKSALSVLTGNVGFKVAAVRRFRALAERADGSLAWLRWAREALGLRGDRCGWDPPPDDPV